MNETKFAHVGLNCIDINKTARFYMKYFGFKIGRVVRLGKGSKIVFLKSGKNYLELFQVAGHTPTVGKDGPVEPGFRHMAFAVRDLDGMLKNLGKSVQVTLGPLDFGRFIKGWKGAWVRDPDGRIVELSQGYKDHV